MTRVRAELGFYQKVELVAGGSPIYYEVLGMQALMSEFEDAGFERYTINDINVTEHSENFTEFYAKVFINVEVTTQSIRQIELDAKVERIVDSMIFAHLRTFKDYVFYGSEKLTEGD